MWTHFCSRESISLLLKKIVSCPYRANPAFVYFRKSKSSLQLTRVRRMGQKIKKVKFWTTVKVENAETLKSNASYKVLETSINLRSSKKKSSKLITRRLTFNALSRLMIHIPKNPYIFLWKCSMYREKHRSIGKKNSYNLRMSWNLGPTLKLEVLGEQTISTT